MLDGISVVPWTADDESTRPVQPDQADRLVDRTPLRDALARISPDQRTAILATVVLGRPYRTGAAALDVPRARPGSGSSADCGGCAQLGALRRSPAAPRVHRRA